MVKTLKKDDISPIRAAAAKVLTNDSDPKTLAALESATSDDSWLVRSAAIDALTQRNDPTAISTLATHLDDDKEAVRYAAAAGVIHLHDVEVNKATAPPQSNKKGAN
jgi:HEAT repeat protein